MKVTYFTLVHSQVAIPKGLRHDVITQQELHKPRTLSGRMDKEAELALSRWRVMGADVAETTMAARVGELKHMSADERREATAARMRAAGAQTAIGRHYAENAAEALTQNEPLRPSCMWKALSWWCHSSLPGPP